MPPFFSVIIPVYNRETQIRTAIDSVLVQSFTNYELIVIDDGSTDRTAEVVKSYGTRVILIEQKNQGASAARNAGIAIARGEYVVFLDSDDHWFLDTLENYQEIIKRHKNPSIICGELVHYYDSPLSFARRDAALKSVAYHNVGQYLRKAPPISFYTPRLVVKRCELQRIHNFTNQRMNAEDIDLVLRLFTAEGFVRMIAPPSFALYRGQNNAVSCNEILNYAGVKHLITTENRGEYPGGSEWQTERWSLILFTSRMVSVRMLKAGMLVKAWEIYLNTFSLHIHQCRIKYLGFFPGLWLVYALRHFLKRTRSSPLF